MQPGSAGLALLLALALAPGALAAGGGHGNGPEVRPPADWHRFVDAVPDGLGHAPAIGPWQDVAPDGNARGCDGRAALVQQWARQQSDAPESRLALSTEAGHRDRAWGILQNWGLKDDSVFGRDVLVRITRADGCWAVEAQRERHYCRRGIDDSDRCL